MSKEELKLTSIDGYELSLAVFKAENPKAVIQMVHGMEEHKERYYDFCEFLAKEKLENLSLNNSQKFLSIYLATPWAQLSLECY